MFELAERLGANANWVIPLFFSFLGGLASLLFQPIMARINQRLALSAKAWERIQSHRIDAYEALLALGRTMRQTQSTGRHDDGFVETLTPHLISDENFDDWLRHFHETVVICEDWVDTKTSQHIKFLADYMKNLEAAYILTPENQREELAKELKQDFIDLSTETASIAHKFFRRIDKRNLTIKGNGKYPLDMTVRKLNGTKLFGWLIRHDQLAKPGNDIPSWFASVSNRR